MTAVLDFAPNHWNTGTRMVAIALADRVNEDDGGRCWPSIADISRRTGLDPRSVQRHIRYLEAEGVLRREGQRTNASGQPVSNLWTWCYWIAGRGDTTVRGRGDTTVTPATRGRGDTTVTQTLRSNHKREPLAVTS